jgi:hypothetical protein
MTLSMGKEQIKPPPSGFSAISIDAKRVATRRAIAEALIDYNWVLYLHGHLTESVLQEFLLLSELVASVSTQPGQSISIFGASQRPDSTRQNLHMKLPSKVHFYLVHVTAPENLGPS